MTGRKLLERFTRRWKWRKAVDISFRALSVTVFAGALSFSWLSSHLLIFGISLQVFLLALFFFFHFSAFRSITLARSARYINKEVSTLEYSSELFLQNRESLNLPERLQYRRMEQILTQVRPPKPPVSIRRTVGLLCVSLFLSAGMLWWGSTQASPAVLQVDQLAEVIQAEAERDPLLQNQIPTLARGKIIVSPPAYTGQKSYETVLAAVEAPEGSNLRWTVHFSDSIRKAWLSLSEGDSIPFLPGGKGDFASLRLQESLLYQLIWEGKKGNTGASDFSRLQAVPDQSPFVQLEEPEPYKRSATPTPFPVEILLKDDYGLTDAFLQLTISSGSGEGVSFTEQQLSFSQDLKGQGKRVRLQKMLNPEELGMEMGNELYYHVVAYDNRFPERQQSRSETYFFQWKDTAAVSSFEVDGMAMEIMPEYFRSQRQIIIDTEKLLSEQSAITDQEFEKRANNLGVDQKLLRLRYGKFLGEEFESGYGQEVLAEEGEEQEQEHKHAGEGEGEGPHQHQHAEDHQEGPPTAENLLREFMHAHDTEEGATFYEERIKVKLKAALAEMWESELRLRTLKPAKALPFQYRALEIIKEVQQATRVYVERIGFEPPPLKPMEKRLTGNLEEVRSGYRTTFIPSTDSLGAIREVISLLKGNSKGAMEEKQLQVLREAGNSLAAIAAQHPKSEHLQGLKLLNRLLNGQELGKTGRQYLLHALLEALPPAGFTPQAPQLYRSQLEQSFMEKIGGTGE